MNQSVEIRQRGLETFSGLGKADGNDRFAQLSALTSLEGKWSAHVGSDCYARAVNVSERPSLIVLMAGFSESTEATRRADVLSRAAATALERIVRSRKRG